MTFSIHSIIADCINLAQPRLGAEVLYVTDEFFAPRERMLSPEAPVFIPDKYDDHGKWMDGWETRRKREAGHDHAIIKLGLPGRIRAVDINTSHFTGNYPPAASLQACLLNEGEPDENTIWEEILPYSALGPDSEHLLHIPSEKTWSHLKLNIYPDGGVARLRVYGNVTRDWKASIAGNEVLDLAALTNGGRPLIWNDSHYGHPGNLLAPGRGLNMGDGWETRRRREPGNDWAIITLGHPGIIERIEIDTAHFKGNHPDSCSIQGMLMDGGTVDSLKTQSIFWPSILAATKMKADAMHSYSANELQSTEPISHLRLNVHPDGGVSRLRIFGRPLEMKRPT